MLEKVKELGLEKFAGNEDLADQFVAGFITHVLMEKEALLEKEAANPRSEQDISREFTDNIAGQLGKGIGGIVSHGAVGGAMIGYRFVTDQFRYQRFLKSLQHAVASSSFLRDQNPAKVEKYADTIYRFAPLVAVDPNLLQSILTNAVQGDGIDLMTIKSLTDLEGRYRDNGSVNPKAFV
jgi:hypothetical protein